MNEKPYTKILQALKTAGYRLTPQRKAICRVLVESDEHPSAQMIYDQLRGEFDSLSLATVYNTLGVLSQAGLINVLGEVGDSEAVRYDADTGPHVNLACVRCERIIDLASHHVQQLDQEVERSSGYTLLGARVLYYGVCPDCQSKQAGKSSDNFTPGGIKTESQQDE
jgi:Fur family transcriptional regulator, peroxide stress response regulator